MLNHLHPCACVQGFGAVQHHGVARLQPSEHLHIALQIVAAQRDRGKAQPVCRALPHAALQPLALHGGQGNHRRGRQGRGVQRYLGQFAHGGQGGGHLGEGHFGQQLLGHAVGVRLHAHHAAGQGRIAARAQADAGWQARGQPHGGALVQAQMNPHAAGHHQLQHGLPGHHGAARLHRAGGNDGRLRRNQLQMLALGAQGGHLGAGALQFLVGSGQGGLGHIALLALEVQAFGAGGLGLGQLGIALQLRGGKVLPGLRLLHTGLGAGLGGLQGADAGIQIDRVHAAQHLPGLHAIAHIHAQRLHPPGHRRPQGVQLPRLHHAQAKQLRGECLLAHLHFGDGDGGHRPGAQGHPQQQCAQGQQHDQHFELGRREGWEFHGRTASL